MRHPLVISICLAGSIALAGCQKSGEQDVERVLEDLNVIDESNLNDVMLNAADPNEAVAYFARTAAANPDRIDVKRGLATSLIRAGNPDDALAVWKEVVTHPEATPADHVNLADALIRTNNWDEAQAALNAVPPTHETYKRYRLEAMVADSNKDWERADSFYETAAGLTTQPGAVYNNWGYSKLTRGQHRDAERLFQRALSFDRNLFTTKNNLVLARSLQRNYELPVIPMTQTERAMLLHTTALSAIKQGDISIGRSILEEAITTHPQHFDAAVRSLRALDNNVNN
ncbi:tetratricopeptide repeat protein [Halocynthiibacter sp.]|uniref:tetratricopeptide repeat protein n=1 Tax=Halocynthiibacter sp. TaxID=1979210 RepID=UPI003C47B5D0